MKCENELFVAALCCKILVPSITQESVRADIFLTAYVKEGLKLVGVGEFALMVAMYWKGGSSEEISLDSENGAFATRLVLRYASIGYKLLSARIWIGRSLGPWPTSVAGCQTSCAFPLDW